MSKYKLNRKFVIIFLCFIFILMPFVYSKSQVVQLNSTNNGIIWDTHVRKDRPNTVEGTFEPNLLTIDDYSSSELARSYVKYNLSPAALKGCIVDNLQYAVMRVFSYNNDGFQNIEGSVHNVYDLSWQGKNENEMTWENQVCGVNFDNSAACNLTPIQNQVFGGNSEVNFDVTSALKYALGSGNSEVSFAIKTAEKSQSKYSQWRAKEYNINPGDVHYLNITCDLDYPKSTLAYFLDFSWFSGFFKKVFS